MEITQATQYFNFNGKGTGFGEDNSIPAIAEKATIIRVYVDVTSVPSVPIPSLVSAKLQYFQFSSSLPSGVIRTFPIYSR
jgi:hypothetical protein